MRLCFGPLVVEQVVCVWQIVKQVWVLSPFRIAILSAIQLLQVVEFASTTMQVPAHFQTAISVEIQPTLEPESLYILQTQASKTAPSLRILPEHMGVEF
jgi:hypothetical protein